MKGLIGRETITVVPKKIAYIDYNGNIAYKTGRNKVCLSLKEKDGENDNFIRLTNEYYSMFEIWDDHFIVCDINSNQNLEYDEKYDDSKLSFKFGVISLQRDASGNVIPMSEKIVVPILYDDIAQSNLKTITAFINTHSTYIDLSLDSKNYGKQLVPAVLEYAAVFSEEYDGFAKCSIDGVVGYLYRNCEIMTSLSSYYLLTEKQVQFLLEFLGKNEEPLRETSNSLKGY